MTFAELDMPPALIAALEKQGITEALDIQITALPLLKAGRNAYLNSETGTGKTLAYLLPLFHGIDPALSATQVLIIAPTHELALQIQRQACDLAVNARWPLRTLLLIGGTSLDRQIEKLKKKPHIVVGSPGRIRDLIGSGKLKTRAVRSVVMDEADRLLCGETSGAVRAILHAVPGSPQMIFVSATEQEESAQEIRALAPDVVMLRTAAAPVNAMIEHQYLICEERDKPDVLRKLLSAIQPDRAIVFVHHNEAAERVAAKLAHHQVSVADLHGAFLKTERSRAMNDFRAGRVRVLMASDVAARGLDIPGVTHIFNLDAPTRSKDYLHRVGRTARAGARGLAVSLLTQQEIRLVRRYAEDLGITLTEIELSQGAVTVRLRAKP